MLKYDHPYTMLYINDCLVGRVYGTSTESINTDQDMYSGIDSYKLSTWTTKYYIHVEVGYGMTFVFYHPDIDAKMVKNHKTLGYDVVIHTEKNFWVRHESGTAISVTPGALEGMPEGEFLSMMYDEFKYKQYGKYYDSYKNKYQADFKATPQEIKENVTMIKSASGGPVISHHNPAWHLYLDSDGYPKGKSLKPQGINKLPGLDEKVKHPVLGTEGFLMKVVISLNDTYKWTREQIADWLETLDVDLRFKVEEKKEVVDDKD